MINVPAKRPKCKCNTLIQIFLTSVHAMGEMWIMLMLTTRSRLSAWSDPDPQLSHGEEASRWMGALTPSS